MTTKGTDNRFRSLTVVGESGTPSTPASGDFKLYVADDGTFFLMDDTGATVDLTAGGGLTDPMTTRGDIIVRNASNVTARLAIGSAGKVLSSDGTDVSWQTPGGGGSYVWLQRQTASSSATLDFTSFISSTYDVYVFEFSNVVPATDNVHLLMRMGTGGGPTYDSGANYEYSNWRVSAAGTGQDGSNSATSIPVDEGSGTNGIKNTAAGGGLSGSVKLYKPSSSTERKSVTGTTVTMNAFDSHLVGNTVGGQYTPTTAVTAIRFLMSSGNIATGDIDVYGVKHA